MIRGEFSFALSPEVMEDMRFGRGFSNWRLRLSEGFEARTRFGQAFQQEHRVFKAGASRVFITNAEL
jgi:hypothetical protein